MRFSSDSTRLVACGRGRGLLVLPLLSSVKRDNLTEIVCSAMAISSDGKTLLAAGGGPRTAPGKGNVALVPIDGGETRLLVDPAAAGYQGTGLAAAFDRGGKRVAVYLNDQERHSIRIFDLATGGQQNLPFEVPRTDPKERAPRRADPRGRSNVPVKSLHFGVHDALYSSGIIGTRRWDIDGGRSEILIGGSSISAISGDGRFLLVAAGSGDWSVRGELVLLDLATGSRRAITTHGSAFTALALDERGTIIASADENGTIRVGTSSGDEPHLLVGHASAAIALDFSPDGRWLASNGETDGILLWEMPDVSKTPIHALPRKQLLERLHALTNLRAARDDATPRGYALKLAPFPGWGTVPLW